MAIRRPNGRWIVAHLPNGDWHPEEVKAAVRMRGSCLEELSRSNNLPAHACRLAARRPHFKGERAIAKYLGLSPRQIWPSRFDRNGARIPQVRNRRQSNASEPAAASQFLRSSSDLERAA